MTSNPRPPLTLQRANQLIKAMDAMTKYLVSLPDDQERLVSMRSQPLSRVGERGTEMDRVYRHYILQLSIEVIAFLG